MSIFFTADLHLGHKNIIRYCGRPFSSVEDMDATIIKNWNAKVTSNDLVYIIGDFAFGQREQVLGYIQKLNGKKILIDGNHDNIGQPKNYGFIEKWPIREIKIEGQHITLSHYAMRVWNKSHFDSWMLYGHSHGTLEPQGKSWDVGVDYNNFEPLSFEEIKKIMESRPHNFNWIERRRRPQAFCPAFFLPGYNPEEFEQARSVEMS